MKHKKSIAASFLLICSTQLAAAPSADLQLHSQDSIHRVQVPSSLLLECQVAGFANIQVLDGSGKSMSMARIWAKPTAKVLRASTSINGVYPLWDRQALPDRSTLRVIEQRGQRSVEWKNTSTSNENSERKQRGVLLDSRLFNKDQQAVQLLLTADIPAGEMIPLQLDISKDLKHWQSIDTDAFLGHWQSENGHSIDKMSIDLPQLALHEHFVRLRWSEALAGEIVIQRVDVISEQQHSTAPLQEQIALGAPESKSQQGKAALIWQFNPPLSMDALQLSTHTLGTNLTVQLQGRASPESPWRTLNRGSVMHLQHAGEIYSNKAFAVNNEHWQALQVVLDDNNAAWPKDIEASVLVPVQQFAFLAQGHAPYHLSCNQQENRWLALGQLIPDYQPGDEYQLPQSSVSLAASSTTVAILQSQPVRPPYLLWAILAAGIVALVTMLVVIIRQLKAAEADQDQ